MRRWSLRSRLVLLLVVANVPAVLLAAVTTVNVQKADRAQRANEVTQRAQVASARIAIKLATVEGVLDNLAADPDVTAGGTACPAILSGALAGHGDYAALMVADARGRALCVGGDPTARLSDTILTHVAAGDQDAMQGLITKSTRDHPASDLLYLARPAKAPDGTGRAIAATLRNAALRQLLTLGVTENPQIEILLVRGDGRVAARVGSGQSIALPAAVLASATGGDLQGENGKDDARYFYAAVPIPHSTFFAVAAEPAAVIDAIDWVPMLTRFGVPILMLVIASVVVYLGLDHMVLRWVREFDDASLAYGRGDFSPRLERFDHAPREMAELGRSFNDMAGRLQEHSTALAVALEGKNRLLRELHHRVKNNFQMIASLLALQRREMPGAMRNLLRVPEDRVLAMAAAYKASYASGEIGQVDLVELMRDVVAQIRQSFGLAAPLVQVGRDGPPITVDLDRAVPMGLLVSEVLSGVLERGEGSIGPLRIEIAELSDEGDATLVEIAIRGPGVGASAPESGLANRLIGAYLAQLNASLERGEERIAIVFAIEAGTGSSGRLELGIA